MTGNAPQPTRLFKFLSIFLHCLAITRDWPVANMCDRAFACNRLRGKSRGATNVFASNAFTGVALNVRATVRKHLLCITVVLLPADGEVLPIRLASATRPNHGLRPDKFQQCRRALLLTMWLPKWGPHLSACSASTRLSVSGSPHGYTRSFNSQPTDYLSATRAGE